MHLLILLIIFRHYVEHPAKNRYKINSYWTTFDSLAEIERVQRKTIQLCMRDCITPITCSGS